MAVYFDRKPFTDWTIIVQDRYVNKDHEHEYFNQFGDFAEFEGIYRTGFSNGKQCEMFSLLAAESDYAYLWVNIFNDGNIEYVAHIPSVININKKKKEIEILPLVYCSFNVETETITLSYVEEYRTKFNMIFE